MYSNGRKFTDKEVITWAKIYCCGVMTLMDMENCLDVSHSTIWWSFQHRLPLLDVRLYDEVLYVLDCHSHSHVHKKGEPR